MTHNTNVDHRTTTDPPRAPVPPLAANVASSAIPTNRYNLPPGYLYDLTPLPLLARLVSQAISQEPDPSIALVHFTTLVNLYLPEYTPTPNTSDSDIEAPRQPDPEEEPDDPDQDECSVPSLPSSANSHLGR